MLHGATRARAGAPPVTCPFPSESSVAWPSPGRAHTHMRAHTVTCVRPNVWLHMVRFGVFKRDQLSLYNIYFLKKTESSSVVEAEGELEASRRAACPPPPCPSW